MTKEEQQKQRYLAAEALIVYAESLKLGRPVVAFDLKWKIEDPDNMTVTESIMPEKPAEFITLTFTKNEPVGSPPEVAHGSDTAGP